MLWFMVDAADAFMRAAEAVGVLTAPGQMYEQDKQSLNDRKRSNECGRLLLALCALVMKSWVDGCSQSKRQRASSDALAGQSATNFRNWARLKNWSDIATSDLLGDSTATATALRDAMRLTYSLRTAMLRAILLLFGSPSSERDL